MSTPTGSNGEPTRQPRGGAFQGRSGNGPKVPGAQADHVPPTPPTPPIPPTPPEPTPPPAPTPPTPEPPTPTPPTPTPPAPPVPTPPEPPGLRSSDPHPPNENYPSASGAMPSEPHPPTTPGPHPTGSHQPDPYPPAQPPYPPRTATLTVPLGKMLYLCVAALGVINLFLGYVGSGDGDSMNLYKAAVAIFALAPTMLFLAGLVSLRPFLPGERAPAALPAMITTAVYVPLVLSAITSSGAGDLQTLFLVFGAVQLVFAWLAYLFDTGVIAARR